MTKDKAAVMEKVHPNLFLTPHVADKLVDLVIGEWQPDELQYEQLATHVTECEPCRTVLAVLLSAMRQDEKPRSSTEVFIETLLSQLADINHKIQAQEYEQMGEYAEAVIAKGKKQADKRFPVLVEHIKNCSTCRSTLEETLIFLRASQS